MKYFLCPLLTRNKNAQVEQEKGLGCPARKAVQAASTSPSRALTVLLPRPQNIQQHDSYPPYPGGTEGDGSRGPALRERIKERPSTTCRASPQPRVGKGRPRRRSPSPAGPRTRSRRRRRPGVRREPGLPGSRSRSTGRGGDKTAARRPAQRPRPRRPTDPQPPRRRRRHRARRGEQWWPPPSPRSRTPPSTPRLGSSPSASCRRHQDTRVRLPHPARSERSSPPHAAGGRGRHRQPPQRLSNPSRLFIPRGAPQPSAPTSPPNLPRWLSRSSLAPDPRTSPKPACSGRLSPLVPLPAWGSPIPLSASARDCCGDSSARAGAWGRRGRACTCSAARFSRPARTALTPSPLSQVPRGPQLSPRPLLWTPPPISSRDSSALGHSDSY
ncbi:serine/arginine repetitive matrix protein 1-like isoform X2 [Equus quagga]|uniref:serine/arginine repetitive matrix protein 1-like isoform X2 n=1 Tax=Equus quagga TaxID=89248 RepID=UPI001EE26B9D|nr:serine/arginine repetitive matrix protein 1-like isoform X2 [Equus quagga]